MTTQLPAAPQRKKAPKAASPIRQVLSALQPLQVFGVPCDRVRMSKRLLLISVSLMLMAAIAPFGELLGILFISLAAVFWLAIPLPIFTQIDDIVLEFTRIHSGRYGTAFLLSVLLTGWLWGIGVFGASALAGNGNLICRECRSANVHLWRPGRSGAEPSGEQPSNDNGDPASQVPGGAASVPKPAVPTGTTAPAKAEEKNASTQSSATQKSLWSFPWQKFADEGILVGTLLGVATIFALLITFAEVREHLRPRAMSFAEALTAAVNFIRTYSERDCQFKLCSYYPSIGAVNREGYREQYRAFNNALKEYQVECCCLSADSLDVNNTNAETLRTLVENLRKRGRPETVEEAVAAFAEMWYASDSGETTASDSNEVEKFSQAMQSIGNELAYLNRESLVKFARFVPDFHFVLALRREAPASAFLLIPLLPAGMPPPQTRSAAPPMIGMEVNDPEILNHLRVLHLCLAEPTPVVVSAAEVAPIVTAPGDDVPAA